MLDHFLTSALEVVIVLDIIGIAAYFILGGLRSKTSSAPVAARPPFWQRFSTGQRQGTKAAPPLDEAAQSFSRILYGFESGLN